MDDLPFVALFTTWEEVLNAWQRLQQYKGRWELSQEPYKLSKVNICPNFMTPSKFCTISLASNEYDNVNFLTDCFTERARLAAKRFDQELSPSEYWSLHGAEMKKKNASANQKQLRALLYAATVEVMNFRLTVAVSVYDMFLPHHVFDPCAGHGDRAIAAMSRKYIESYEGCEPNVTSQKGIVNAIKVFGGLKHICVHPIPFEDYQFLSEATCDLVFTSPPYYDVEIYCQDKTQSIMKFHTEKEWYQRFLLLTFLRCWQHVCPNGHMVISINNVRDRRNGMMRFSSTEKLVKDLTLLCLHAKFLGVVAFGNKDQRMEPMFVWQKIPTIAPTCTYKQLQNHKRKRQK